MKKTLALVALVGLAAVHGGSQPVYADMYASAVTRVHVQINPQIAMSANSQIWELGSVQNGTFSVAATWRVDANEQYLQFCLEASKLYKAGDPNSSVLPIPLDQTPPTIEAQHGGVGGQAGPASLPWSANSGEQVVNGFPVAKTQSVVLESSDAGNFSQNVTTTVSWYLDPTAQQPTGDYYGVIKLMGLIPPQPGQPGS